jgi:8-oxo-dGTP pyrophosphatase MutT (NUDIX family)
MTSSRFRRLAERELFRGELITVAEATVEAPDGTRYTREIVHHPGAVSVVPVIGHSEEVLLVRQYRAAVDRELLEIPAGKRDVAGEPPQETARRELLEEVGMRAGRLEQLAEFYNSPGFCDEYTHLYCATELSALAERRGVTAEEEAMSIERVPLAATADLIAAGELIDAKSIVGLLLTQQLLERERAGRG